MLGVVKPAWGVQGDGGRAAGLTLCCSHCTVPGWLPLCRSLSIPRQPVHSLFSDLPGAVNILTFQVPTCHHPSQAIRIAVQGFPSGSGINGEQKGTARGNGPQGRHTGEEGAGGHCPSVHTDQMGGPRPREQEGPARVLTPSSDCLQSHVASRGSFLTFLIGTLHCVLRPPACIPPKEGDSRSHQGCGLKDLYLYAQCLAQGWPQSKCIIKVPPTNGVLKAVPPWTVWS